jgi:hypothetical protein
MLGVPEWNINWVEVMLRTELPKEWVFDTALAAAAPNLRGPKLRLATANYLAARLQEDLPMLVDEEVLSAGGAASLWDALPDNSRAWAVLRAADMFSESGRLKQLDTSFSSEYQRAVFYIVQMCENRACVGVSETPPAESLTDSASALALAYGFTRDGTRPRLYEGEALAQHRQLLKAASGRDVNAPLLVADFDVIDAADGATGFWQQVSGRGAGGEYGCAWLDEKSVEKQLTANGGWSHTTLHELVHTLQGWEEECDIETAFEQIRIQTLIFLLGEGATDSYTQTVLRDHIKSEPDNGYGPHRAFTQALSTIIADGEGSAETVVQQLALCEDSERPQLAAQLLCDMATPATTEALVEAACEYAKFVYDEPVQEAEMTGGEPVERSPKEMFLKAEELLVRARVEQHPGP